MVDAEVLAVPGVAEEDVVVVQDLERQAGRVAVLAVRHHVVRLGQRLDPAQDLLNGDAGPAIAEAAPAGDTVDVRHHVFRRQRAQLAVVELERVADGAENAQIPLREVRLGDRSEMQERPTVGGAQGLAGRNPRGVDALWQPPAFEDRGHRLASIGAAYCGPVTVNDQC